MMNADGSEPRQLTGDKIFKFSPTVSPNGKHIVYTTSQNGGQVVRMDSGGGNPVMLTRYNNSVRPDVSPDGKWVIHYAYVDGRTRIVRVPLDGATFACFLEHGFGTLAIVPAEGGNVSNAIMITEFR